MRTNKKRLLFTTVALLTLAGCASNPDSSSALLNDAAQSETNIQVAKVKTNLDTASKKLAQAEQDDLFWFAKEPVEDATEALTEAKENYSVFEFTPSKANESTGLFSSQTYIEATQENLKQFDESLTKAQSIRTKSLETLSQAFENRRYLDELDASEYFPKTIEELNKELKSLVDDVAEGNTDEAIEKQPDLASKQDTLIVKVTSKIYFSEAEEKLSSLLKADIANHAPRSISQASATLTAAKAFVSLDPRAIEAIKEKSNEVLFTLEHAAQIATAVKNLKATQSKDYENYLLSIENILLEISSTLGAEDGRDQNLVDQGKAIVQFIEQDLKDEQSNLKAQQADKNALTLQKLELDDKNEKIKNLEKQLNELNTQLTSAQSKQTGLQLALDQALQEQATSEAEEEQEPTEDQVLVEDEVIIDTEETNTP